MHTRFQPVYDIYYSYISDYNIDGKYRMFEEAEMSSDILSTFAIDNKP